MKNEQEVKQKSDFMVADFTNMLYEKAREGFVTPLEIDKEQWETYRARRLEEIKKHLRIDLFEEYFETKLQYELLESQEKDGVTIEKYRVDRIKNLPLCVYALRPQKPNGKAILYLTGHDPRGAVGVFQPNRDGTRGLGMDMVSLGYLVLVPELFAFGEAKEWETGPEADGCAGCERIAPGLLNSGFSIVGIRVYEAMKTLDFAEAAFDIHSFAAYGISGGGHVCNYTGVLEPRVDTVMIAAYANLYKYSILPIRHCICNYVPAQLELGESHEVTALAAPKRLLTINGRQDPIFPLQGSEETFAYLDALYEKLGAGDQYTHILFEGGHESPDEEICRWLQEAWR